MPLKYRRSLKKSDHPHKDGIWTLTITGLFYLTMCEEDPHE